MSSAPPRSAIPKLDELPLVIDTPRLRLRPVTEADAGALFPHTSDPEVAQYVTWSPHKDLEETRGWLRDVAQLPGKGEAVVWAIEHEGTASGCIGVHDIRWALRGVRRDLAEMGYWLAKPLWGKGIATEAATAATRWAFETLGLHKVTIGCFEPNIGSRKVIERVGFRYLCRQEEDVWKEGRWLAHLRYELTAGEWADSTRTLRFNRPRPGA